MLWMLCVALTVVMLSLYMQNVKFRQENRALLLTNDSLLSANQKLHKRLNMKSDPATLPDRRVSQTVLHGVNEDTD